MCINTERSAMFSVIDGNGYVVEVCNSREEAEMQSDLYPYFTRVEELEDFFEDEEVC
jgi:hypothetical protein